MQRRAKHFVTTHRCGFLDLDPFGHMNTTCYVSHFIDHRFQGLREVLGLDLKSIAKLPIVFVTKNLNIDFILPVYGDEVVEIRSHVSDSSANDCLVQCEMRNGKGRIVSACSFLLVCVDKQTNRPCPWPTEFIEKFYELEQNNDTLQRISDSGFGNGSEGISTL